MGSRGMAAHSGIGSKGATKRRRTPEQGRQRGIEFAKMKRISAATGKTGRTRKVAVARGKTIDKNKNPADRT